ncbi:hypothetical protein KRX56_06160 [Dermabacteraceae bacterium TAE3-ERU27]|nr:hypothetical protein [Dermabacteraceae bacterium TAE3-ERU27]
MSDEENYLELSKTSGGYLLSAWIDEAGEEFSCYAREDCVVTQTLNGSPVNIPHDKWAEIVAHIGVEPATTQNPPDRLFADLQAAWNAGTPLPDGKTVPAGSVPIRKNADGAYRVHPKPVFPFTVEHGERWRIAGPVPDLALSIAKAVTACTPHNKSRRVFYRPANGHKGWWTAFGEEYEPGELLEVKEIEL